ncbi:MAG: WG repeat-containing protein [Bacillota bacterium]|jgi:hypothetical protein|nr:WG repeat-containing protein [Bacillota bacterium]HHU43197.1 WG repeat-containing protein [Clostridiales bacterium]
MANPRRKKKKPVDNYKPPFDKKILEEPIESLKFKVDNTLELLKSGGLRNLGDIVRREEKDFYKIFKFKKRNLIDVIKAIKPKKLYLKPSQKETAESTPQPKEKKSHKPKKAPADIYVKFNKGGKWGFTDRNGKVVIPPQFDEVFSYKEDLCCVEKDERFGFIDREGVEVVPIIYECALSFSEGLACVFKGGKCGYINKENEVVIDFQFDAGTSVENGKCHIKRDEKWGELTISDPANIRWIN